MIFVPSALDLIPSQFCVVFAIAVKVPPLFVDFQTAPVNEDPPLLPSPAVYTVVPSALPVMPLG
jgi:hypothetical protein